MVALRSSINESFLDETPAQSTLCADDEAFDEPRAVKWTADEFHRIGELGLFEGRHVELIEGKILEMSPMLRPHALALLKTANQLGVAFPRGHFIQTQMPLPLAPGTDPEPDVAVFAGAPEDFPTEHPTQAVLIVEISYSTLRFDQTTKASLYARAGIIDYWIVNLNERRLEVFRAPQENADAPFGWYYAETKYFVSGESVAPLHAPNAPIGVDDLLP